MADSKQPLTLYAITAAEMLRPQFFVTTEADADRALREHLERERMAHDLTNAETHLVGQVEDVSGWHEGAAASWILRKMREAQEVEEG